MSKHLLDSPVLQDLPIFLQQLPSTPSSSESGAPSASAGLDHVVDEGQLVVLDGIGSGDVYAGDKLSYSCKKLGGSPTVNLIAENTNTLTWPHISTIHYPVHLNQTNFKMCVGESSDSRLYNMPTKFPNLVYDWATIRPLI